MIEPNIELNINSPWISAKDNPIPQGPFVIAYNQKWVDEDFNPQGVRIGFQSDDGFISAYWWDEQDDFIAIAKWKWEGDPEQESFFEHHLDNSEPTYWMPIPPFDATITIHNLILKHELQSATN